MTDKVFNYGRFVWREMMSSDLAASRKFYEGLFGWKIEEQKMGDAPYLLIHANGKQIAGMMSIPPGAHFPPFWHGYVSVPEVDTTLAKVAEHGGRVLMPAMDVEHVGRFAPCMDPTGAVFTAYQSSTGGQKLERPGAGEFCWEQLNSKDEAGASAFYKSVLGWNTVTSSDGSMKTFSIGPEMSDQIASLWSAPPESPTSHWLTYVVVNSLAEARTKCVELGGTIMIPEIPVPTIGTFAVASDNVGAVICLFQSA